MLLAVLYNFNPRKKIYKLIEPVYIASKLEKIAKVYGTCMMVDEITREEIREKFHVREIDITTMRGRSKHITLYEVIANSKTDLQHDFMTVTYFIICKTYF